MKQLKTSELKKELQVQLKALEDNNIEINNVKHAMSTLENINILNVNNCILKELNFYNKIIKNNINNIIHTYFMENTMAILRRYKDKKVGGKTKEKIINEVETDIKENLINSDKVYFNYGTYYYLEISLSINCYDIRYTKYDSKETLYYTYTDKIYNKQDSNRLLKKYKDTINKRDKLKKEYDKITLEINNDLTDNLSDLKLNRAI